MALSFSSLGIVGLNKAAKMHISYKVTMYIFLDLLYDITDRSTFIRERCFTFSLQSGNG